jgi:glycosyltransferase involved in cell wall biosynthesis
MSLPEILMLSTYPPRECGIATYTNDLIHAIQKKYQSTFQIQVGALENTMGSYLYEKSPYFQLKTEIEDSYIALAAKLKDDSSIQLVVIQHEFGLFEAQKSAFLTLLEEIQQPIILVLHTVLPFPNPSIKKQLKSYSDEVDQLVVMTELSAHLLETDYEIKPQKIQVIPHGTHLLSHVNREELKLNFDLQGRTILSTFGFIGTNKSIETSLEALPEMVKRFPNLLFLIIGKTHPNVLASDGEKYRNYLENLVESKGMVHHVKWINCFLPTLELLDYLSLTDVYLFTSNDPNQAVSGTFSYAISSGCPVVSTRIPHAVEVLKDDMGILIDFNNHEQLAQAVIELLENTEKRNQMRINSLQNMAVSAWENSAIRHMNLFRKMVQNEFALNFRWPAIDLKHLERLTTPFGIIQFAHMNEPDLSSGYTIDDNARALMVVCDQYQLSGSAQDLYLMEVYLKFIHFCQQEDGLFLNYVSYEEEFTSQNADVNLDDSIGRTIWSLGYLISLRSTLPALLVAQAEMIFEKALDSVYGIHSPRAMAFIIKGIFYSKRVEYHHLLDIMAMRLAAMYNHEAKENWWWFESYFSYANAVLPEAMLMASQVTGKQNHRKIAEESFGFLMEHTFDSNGLHVISNEYWLGNAGSKYEVQTKAFSALGGEQAIDVCYSILALYQFNQVNISIDFLRKMQLSFDWFLGKNHLNQIMYNPSTGGCYDGLELQHVNLNQGAESTISYLIARHTMQKVQADLWVQKQEQTTQFDVSWA